MFSKRIKTTFEAAPQSYEWTYYLKGTFITVTATDASTALTRLREATSAAFSREAALVKSERKDVA